MTSFKCSSKQLVTKPVVTIEKQSSLQDPGSWVIIVSWTLVFPIKALVPEASQSLASSVFRGFWVLGPVVRVLGHFEILEPGFSQSPGSCVLSIGHWVPIGSWNLSPINRVLGHESSLQGSGSWVLAGPWLIIFWYINCHKGFCWFPYG